MVPAPAPALSITPVELTPYSRHLLSVLVALPSRPLLPQALAGLLTCSPSCPLWTFELMTPTLK